MTPTIGRIVQYRIAQDEYRPAIVVRVNPEGSVNLQIFIDGSNDRPIPGASMRVNFREDELAKGIAWRTSVREGNEAGQWRWPPRE
ncbi:MAG: hypothetical protein OHK006_12950 [Thermodesulfovibrionales bacterium]